MMRHTKGSTRTMAGNSTVEFTDTVLLDESCKRVAEPMHRIPLIVSAEFGI